MKLSDAKEVIKSIYSSTDSVTALVSERGVGKTSAYQQSAKELGIEYIGLYAAALEGPDFMGLPAKDLDKGVTRYLAPQFLPTKKSIASGLHEEKGLLVLEEINRVPSDTVSVLYPLLLERKINGHTLGEGWKIGVTMNPDSMNYLVNSLDDAMLDRFITIKVEPTLEDYVNYSRANNGHEQVLEFLQSNPDLLLVVSDSSHEGMMEKTATPRGWTKVQEILNQCYFTKEILGELLTGIVGSASAAAFIGFSSGWDFEVPSAKSILTAYEDQRDQLKRLIDEKQMPVLSSIIDNIIKVIEEDSDQVQQLDHFLKLLPDELLIYFYKTCAREKEAMIDYLSDNSMHFEYISDLIVDKMSA